MLISFQRRCHQLTTLGETTVARFYASFLTLVGVSPGNSFMETTGSRLANHGVSVVTTHIEGIRNAGGVSFRR